ncbi:CBO0543 family protein [Halanaerobacter jeridensis]|uniref:Uncharacterized protein n=1 Tax=Halanaerobacter jeridensis TaxID=706427 RepID=A0A938XX70_9FIRM|nr:CBO0543 family protein [Halanaerobacter jeridensis]MBM7557906.1 hypothetical protein [Halanaerobacter jeridensis]
MSISLIWIYLFAGLTILLFLIVPRKQVMKLLPFGFIAGFGLAFILQYFAVNIFRWWKFNYALVDVLNAPVGVSLSWVPAVMIFAYFWQEADSKLKQLIYIIIFSLGTTIVEYSFVILDYRQYINWNVYLTFILAFIIHSILAAYLYLNTEKNIVYSS